LRLTELGYQSPSAFESKEMSDHSTLTGPDLTLGLAQDKIADGATLLGHVAGEQVVLARTGDEFFAVGAYCTHYHGPLSEGLVVGGTIRCPWHHACFDLRTGEALQAPAFDSLSCWVVEQRGERVFVSGRMDQPKTAKSGKSSGDETQKVLIVGGGAAGFAAAEMLRRKRFVGTITMVSCDAAAPVDRPNLSKDYLAGNAPEDWVPLRPESFYSDNEIELRLATEVVRIDPAAREVALSDGATLPYDRLLLATGADPVRLWIPGADQTQVHSLRSFADCRGIIARAETARSAIILGASFIGLEVAAALRNRGIDVHIVAPERRPLERILGPDMGQFVQSLHEEHGVIFHLNETAVSIAGNVMTLKSGNTLEGELVIAGIGVRPRIDLAVKAGLLVDRGVAVNSFLETSAPGVYAAGDIARWPDPYSRQNIRVEHWVVAERQGQTAALNMIGHRQRFSAVPFFWSQHYDVSINYVGHAESWDEIAIDGNIARRDCVLRFKKEGRTLALASIFRDCESLQGELAMEREAEARSA
jgi:NADPH-dependent 2,4-dienoyl-CoA reductase/sulfur reductase-like enzyme/nitrite reductase/ring-hydroxylating ferredoxin subunit